MLKELSVFKTSQIRFETHEEPSRPWYFATYIATVFSCHCQRLLNLIVILEMPWPSGGHGEGGQPKRDHEMRVLSLHREVLSMSHLYIKIFFLLLYLNCLIFLFLFPLPILHLIYFYLMLLLALFLHCLSYFSLYTSPLSLFSCPFFLLFFFDLF